MISKFLKYDFAFTNSKVRKYVRTHGIYTYVMKPLKMTLNLKHSTNRKYRKTNKPGVAKESL